MRHSVVLCKRAGLLLGLSCILLSFSCVEPAPSSPCVCRGSTVLDECNCDSGTSWYVHVVRRQAGLRSGCSCACWLRCLVQGEAQRAPYLQLQAASRLVRTGEFQTDNSISGPRKEAWFAAEFVLLCAACTISSGAQGGGMPSCLWGGAESAGRSCRTLGEWTFQTS